MIYRCKGSPSRFRRGSPCWDQVRVPPVPAVIVLTDRATGVKWRLWWNGDYFSIIDDPVANNIQSEVHEYGAYEGPLLYPVGRLLIRNGYLGYEAVTNPGSSGRVIARKTFRGEFREVYVPTSWRNDGDTLAWDSFTK